MKYVQLLASVSDVIIFVCVCVCVCVCVQINPLTLNDPYSDRTAPLTSKIAFYIFNKYRY